MPIPHPADSHDLIRVRGARENNLQGVNIDLPKRRLTVFTGVSGSGKSSLVLDTIAAESQRMINETHSAFVQGFLPTLDRPDVDVLDGLTTTIIVDQERLGTNPRSTLGTATDVNTQLRILFSRLGKPHIGGPKAFSFNEAYSQTAWRPVKSLVRVHLRKAVNKPQCRIHLRGRSDHRRQGREEGQGATRIRGGRRHVSAL